LEGGGERNPTEERKILTFPGVGGEKKQEEGRRETGRIFSAPSGKEEKKGKIPQSRKGEEKQN